MKSVVIVSGGMDSVTLLRDLWSQGDELLALSIDYGQRHKKELDYARAAAQTMGIQWELADLTGVTKLLGGSSQTDPSIQVPEGHYAEESMKKTVVPNRNMLMLAVAGAWAISQKADRVAYAAHAGDHAIYPDCRPEFVAALGVALGLADWHRVVLYGPYTGMTKAQIVARGAELGVAFEYTWSCYKGGEVHCGRCGTCWERREAFMLAGVKDPTVYASSEPLEVR